MTLDKIIAISGKPGLYEILTQNKAGLVVESLTDKKRMSVNLRQQLSALKDIAVYTHLEEVPLRDVFVKIFDKDQGKASIDLKSNSKDLLAYFETILPDFDEERVYASTVKKILTWYNILFEKEFDFKALAEENQAAENEEQE